MNLREYIKLESLSLAVGDTTREVECPACPNNDKEKGSLTITRLDNGIVYNCYRAKCGFHGFIPSFGYELTTKTEPKQFEPKVFKHPLELLPMPIKHWLQKIYNLTDDDILHNELKYAYTENRLWYPFNTIDGQQLGCCVKKLPKAFINPETDMERYLFGNKSIAYWESDSARLDFPVDYLSIQKKLKPGIVLVEDKLSAIRVNRFMRCASLSGSELDNKQIELLTQLTNTIILALDLDTWWQKGKDAKSVKFWKKYSLFFKNFELRFIKTDPKEMTDNEIIKYIVNGE